MTVSGATLDSISTPARVDKSWRPSELEPVQRGAGSNGGGAR